MQLILVILLMHFSVYGQEYSEEEINTKKTGKGFKMPFAMQNTVENNLIKSFSINYNYKNL